LSTGDTTLRVCAKTDVGKVRSSNQDSFFIEPAPAGKEASHGRLVLVADGMGGHAAGEVASALASETASGEYYDFELSPDDDPLKALRRAFQEANRAILVEGSKNLDYYGMGTTCSAVVLRGELFWTCHVGDSRVYRFRGGQLELLTKDHTLLSQMLEKGDLNPREASRLSIGHILVRAMGIDNKVELDVSENAFPILPGDKVLLCSDGLHGVLSDEQITSVLSTLEGEEVVETLVAEALSEGGPDNVTVVLVERTG